MMFFQSLKLVLITVTITLALAIFGSWLPSFSNDINLQVIEKKGDRYFQPSDSTFSKLDPYITLDMAIKQAEPIARFRKIDYERLSNMVEEYSVSRLSKQRVVNVNLLNEKLDERFP